MFLHLLLQKLDNMFPVFFCDASQSLHYRHLVQFVVHSFRAEREKNIVIF
jgi:hypothetical protein